MLGYYNKSGISRSPVPLIVKNSIISKMSILVANYGSSSSDSEEDAGEDAAPLSAVEKVDSKETSGVNLLTSTNTDSDDDSDDNGKLSLLPRSLQQKKKTTSTNEALKAEHKSKLPLPSFMMQSQKFESSPQTITDTSKSTSSSSSSSSSVFANQFEKAEQQKLSILEQHVKLSSTEKTEAEMGKKICWMFRKGRCRFGHKCKFAHDNDISLKQAKHEGDIQEEQAVVGGNNGPYGGYQNDSSQQGTGFGGQHQRQPFPQQGHFQSGLGRREDDISKEDEEQFQMRKRKKPGLAQGLVPPKRSMASYQKHAAQERPWTKQ